MLNEALGQLLDWGVAEIQEYGKELSKPLIDFFQEKGSFVENEAHRAHHLMGLALPPGTEGEALVGELQARNIYVSLRGNNIRISVNVFNTEDDVRQLMDAL